MNKEDIFKKTVAELKNVYEQYKSRGLVSIYLWGSITTPDFNPQKSDIDSVGIIDSTADKADQELINTILENGPLKGLSLKINYLFLDELNGKEVRTELGKVIEPPLLLLDFPFWIYVAGKKFSRADFQSKDIAITEAVQIEIDKIKKRFLPFDDTFRDYKYFLKTFARLLYYLQQGDTLKEPFSYSSLQANATKETRDATDAFLKIKSENWDIQLFKEALPLFLNIVEKNDNCA